MKTKTFPAMIKSVNPDTREVTQIVSVFGNVDHHKDRVIAGAFANTLARWEAKGDPIPAIWSHQWDNPFAHIGVVTEHKELMPGDPELPDTPIPNDPENRSLRDLGGLKTVYKVDEGREFADQVYWLLDNRRVNQASFAYDVVKSRQTSDGVEELTELDLFEVGPTLLGANDATTLLHSKSIAAVEESESEKKSVSFAGSVEEKQETLHGIAEAWAEENADPAGGLFGVQLHGTFDDHVVFRVEGWDDPIGGGEFYDAPIETASDGTYALGQPVEVALEVNAVPKSREMRTVLSIMGAQKTAANVGRQSEAGNGNDEASEGDTSTEKKSVLTPTQQIELDALDLLS